MSDKGLISKIYLKTHITQEFKKNQFKKTVKGPEWAFFKKKKKKDIQAAKRCMKICSSSLTIREMQIKTTRGHHSHLLEWLSSKR